MRLDRVERDVQGGGDLPQRRFSGQQLQHRQLTVAQISGDHPARPRATPAQRDLGLLDQAREAAGSSQPCRAARASVSVATSRRSSPESEQRGRNLEGSAAAARECDRVLERRLVAIEPSAGEPALRP